MSNITYSPLSRKRVAFKSHFGALLKELFAATPLAIFFAALRTPIERRLRQLPCNPPVLAGCIGNSVTPNPAARGRRTRQRLR